MAKTKGDAGFDLTASRKRPRHRRTKARLMPQPGQRWPVARWIGQRSGRGRRQSTSDSPAAGSWAAAESAPLASRTPAAAVLGLTEFLPKDIAKLIHHHHLTALPAGRGDDRPDDPPKEAGEDREDRVEGVVDGLSFHEDCLKVVLRLDPKSPSRRRLKLLGEDDLSFVSRPA